MTLSPITDHAMMRYLERICGLNIRDLKMKAKKLGYAITTDAHFLAFVQKEEKIDVNRMRENLVTPELKAALAMDARTIRLDGIVMILRAGRVMTLYRPASIKEHAVLKPHLKKGQFAGTRKNQRMWEYDQDDERV